MNRFRFALLGLGLLLAVSAARAQQAGVKANIPFEFVVGNQVLPAGEYLMVPEGSTHQVVRIRSDEGKSLALSLTNTCTAARPSNTTKLVFHIMGGRYFLSQIWTQGYDQGRQLPKSKSEIELAKNGNQTGEFVLAANLIR